MVTPLMRFTSKSRAKARLREAALRATPFETGGLLLGWREDETVVVDAVLEIAPNKKNRTRYVLDEVRANVALQAHKEQCSDSRVGYVGIWHSHPSDVPASATDKATIRAAGRKATAPLAFIVAAVRGRSVRLHKYWVAGAALDSGAGDITRTIDEGEVDGPQES